MRNSPGIVILVALGIFLLPMCEWEKYPQGKRLYTVYCENCHMEDGTGLEGLIPPLAGSDLLRDRQEEVPCIIRYGQSGPIIVNGITYDQEMVGIPELNETHLVNIINYINSAWGNDFGFMQPDSIGTYLERCPNRD